MEKILLINICEQAIKNNKKISWFYTDEKEDETIFNLVDPEEPIISFLQDKTGIRTVRRILRKLIEKNLVYCSEEENVIHIVPAIVKNVETMLKQLRTC